LNEIILCLILSFSVLFLLMFLGVPIGWSMMLGGFVGFACAGMFSRGLYLASYTAWSVSTMQSLVCIPLYLIMGQFLFLSGMTSRLFEMAMSLLSRLKLKGGLAMAVVIACAFFGAVSGSIAAAISAFGPVVMPEAVKYKYDKNFLATILATAGSLASLIPPSLNLIMYGILTETSIAKLFVAGIIPGIFLTLIYCFTVYIMVKRNPSLARTTLSPMSWRQTGRLTLSNFPILIVVLLVLGGIYLGWFTPTESAGVGAAAVLILALAARRLKLSQIIESFLGAGRTLGMILVLLIGAFTMAGFVTVSQCIPVVTQFIVDLGLSHYTFLLAIWILYFIMGCTIISAGMMVLTLPILFPIVVAMDIDPIWFGIFCNLAAEVAQVTPPVGLNIFTMQGVANDPEVTTVGMFRLIWPLVVGAHVCVILITLFPQICLWLPGTMK
jgi:C4-dicarboxylate transporter DctM subunit